MQVFYLFLAWGCYPTPPPPPTQTQALNLSWHFQFKENNLLGNILTCCSTIFNPVTGKFRWSFNLEAFMHAWLYRKQLGRLNVCENIFNWQLFWMIHSVYTILPIKSELGSRKESRKYCSNQDSQMPIMIWSIKIFVLKNVSSQFRYGWFHFKHVWKKESFLLLYWIFN